MNNFNPGWYLIYTKPRHERKVDVRLSEIQVRSFLPLTKRLHNWHDRRKYVEEPLFPSYVFVYLNDMQDYYGAMDVEGSLYYVRIGKQIARVNDTIFNNIKLLVDQKREIEVSADRFDPGQKLVINQGALTGLACEVVKVNKANKLLVRVDLLQRNILLSLPAEHLVAV